MGFQPNLRHVCVTSVAAAHTQTNSGSFIERGIQTSPLQTKSTEHRQCCTPGACACSLAVLAIAGPRTPSGFGHSPSWLTSTLMLFRQIFKLIAASTRDIKSIGQRLSKGNLSAHSRTASAVASVFVSIISIPCCVSMVVILHTCFWVVNNFFLTFVCNILTHSVPSRQEVSTWTRIQVLG